MEQATEGVRTQGKQLVDVLTTVLSPATEQKDFVDMVCRHNVMYVILRCISRLSRSS